MARPGDTSRLTTIEEGPVETELHVLQTESPDSTHVLLSDPVFKPQLTTSSPWVQQQPIATAGQQQLKQTEQSRDNPRTLSTDVRPSHTTLTHGIATDYNQLHNHISSSRPQRPDGDASRKECSATQLAQYKVPVLTILNPLVQVTTQTSFSKVNNPSQSGSMPASSMTSSPRGPAGHGPAHKLVHDVGRAMQRVRAGQALMDKLRFAMGDGLQPVGMVVSSTALSAAPGHSLRRGAPEDQLVPVFSSVTLPACPQQMLLAGGRAQLVLDVLSRQGLTRSDMRKVLDQLPHFSGLDARLVQALADACTLYNYPANTQLYSHGAVCSEMHILLSGQVRLQQPGAHELQLQPGTVLGSELFTKAVRMPCEVWTNSNFDTRIASLSFAHYQAVLVDWAAGQLLQLLPALPPSRTARIREVVQAHARHLHKEGGSALYKQGDPARELLLLVKGQVLVSRPLPPDVVQTEGQIVNTLRTTLGDTGAVVPIEPPRLTQRTGRTSDASLVFESTLMRKMSMRTQASVNSASMPSDRSHSVDPDAIEEGDEQAGGVLQQTTEGSFTLTRKTLHSHNSSVALLMQANLGLGPPTSHEQVPVQSSGEGVELAEPSAAQHVSAHRMSAVEQDTADAAKEQCDVTAAAATALQAATPTSAAAPAAASQLAGGVEASQQPGLSENTVDLTTAISVATTARSSEQYHSRLPSPDGLGPATRPPSLPPTHPADPLPTLPTSSSQSPAPPHQQPQSPSGPGGLGVGPHASQPHGFMHITVPTAAGQMTTTEGAGPPVPVLSGVQLVKGVPLYSALASILKSNQQQLQAVYSHQQLFMGEEGLASESPSAAPVYASTVLAMSAVEAVSIPLKPLLAALPQAALQPLARQLRQEQLQAALRQTGHQVHQRWPDSASSLREYLATLPGTRPSWQVEALADGFSSLPTFAAIPWQARLRLFQELTLLRLPVGPHSSLALAEVLITVTWPQDTSGSGGTAGIDPHDAPQSTSQLELPAMALDVDDIPDDVYNSATEPLVPLAASHPANATSGQPGITDTTDTTDGAAVAGQAQEAPPLPLGAQQGAGVVVGGGGAGAAVSELGHPPLTAPASLLPLPATFTPTPRPPARVLGPAEGGKGLLDALDGLCTAGSAARDLRLSNHALSSPAASGHLQQPGPGPEAGLSEQPVPDQVTNPGLPNEEAEPGLPDQGTEPGQTAAMGAVQGSQPGSHSLAAPDQCSSPAAVAQCVGGDGSSEQQPGSTKAAGPDPALEQGCEAGGLEAEDLQRVTVGPWHPGTLRPWSVGLEAGRASSAPAAVITHQAAAQRGASFDEHRLVARATARRPDLGRPELVLGPDEALSGWDPRTPHHTPGLAPQRPTSPLLLRPSSQTACESPTSAAVTSPPPASEGPRSPTRPAYAPYHLNPPSASPAPSRQPSPPTLMRIHPSPAHGPSASPACLSPRTTGGVRARPRSPVKTPPKTPPRLWVRPSQVKCISLKKDDRVFITVGGQLVLEAWLQPDDPVAASTAVSQALAEAGNRAATASRREQEGKGRKNRPASPPNAVTMAASPAQQQAWVDPLQPVMLQQLAEGTVFHSGMALELALLQPPGARCPCSSSLAAQDLLASSSQTPDSVPAIAGRRVIMARPCPTKAAVTAAGGGGAELSAGGNGSSLAGAGSRFVEVLCMSKPMFELTVRGAGRLASSKQVEAALEAQPWAPPLWQGIRPEGLLAMRGLLSGSPPVAGTLMDVVKKLGGSCRLEEYKAGTELLRRGEPAAALHFVVSGTALLRAGFVGLLPGIAASSRLTDLTLLKEGGCAGQLSLLSQRALWYSVVVSSSAATVMTLDLASLQDYVRSYLDPEGQERLLQLVAQDDVHLYSQAVHAQAQLLQQGMLELSLFVPNMKHLLQKVLSLGQLDMSLASATQGPSDASQGAAGQASRPEGVSAQCPVIIEDAHKADLAIRQLARPAAAPGRPDQLADVAKLQHHLAAQASFVDDITRGSSVHRAQTRPNHGAPGPVLHVTMPVASTEEVAYKRAGSIRMPQRVERRPVPKMLQGSELESAVLPEKQILPPTIVTACRQVETLGVKVHLKLPALQQLAYTGHPTDSTRTAIQPLRDGAQASPLHGREHQLHAQYLADKLGLSLPSSATTAAPIIAVDYPSVAPRRTLSATASGLSVATAARAAYRDQHNPGASIVAGQQTSPHQSPAVRRDQESHGMPLSGPSAASLAQQQPRPSEVPASRRFGGTALKPSATTIRRRVREVEGPRTLQRSLTAGLWDTSQGALKKLLAHRTHQNVEQAEAGEMLRAEESWAEQGSQGQGERALDSVVFGPSEPSSAPSTEAQQEVQPAPVLVPMSAISDLSTQQQHQQQGEQDQACLTNTLDACSPTLTVPVTAPGHSPDSLLQAPLSLRTVSPGNASMASVQWVPGDVLDQPAMAGSSGATGGPVLAKRASLKTTPILSPSAPPPTTVAPPFLVTLPYQAPTIAIPPPWPWPDQQPYAPSPTTSPAPDAQPLSRLDAVALAHLPDTLDYLTPSLSRNGVLLEHAEQVVGSRAAPPSPGVEAALAVVMHQRLAAQRRWSATWGDVAGSRQGSPSSPRLRTQDPLACSPAGSARGSPDGRRSPGSPSPRRRGPGSPLSRLGSPDLVAPRSMQCGPDPGRPGLGFIPEGILLALAAQEAKSVARARSPTLVATGQSSAQGLTTIKAAPAGLKRSRQRPHTQPGQAEAAALVQHLQSHAVPETSSVDFINTLHHSNRSLTAGEPLPQPGPGSGFGQQSAVPRDLWVRDALHDPSNASNPAMAGLLTDAVRQQLLGPWARQVEITMDSPNTGLPPAAMRDAPGQQVDAGEAQLVARAEAAAEKTRKGPVPQSQPLAPCALPRTQLLAPGMLERAPTLLSSSARAPGETSTALALSMPRSATELVLTNMTVYSTSRVLRNRLRLKEAKLQARPVGRGASIADDGSSCPVSQTQSQASLSATDSMPLMIPEVKGPRSLPQPRLAVHSDKLLQSDVAYITMCAPPRPKHSIPSTVHARPEHVVQTSGTAQLPKAPVPGSHVAAMMAEVTEQMASLAPAADPPTHYTPTFLRPTRKSIVPSVQHVKSEKQQWVVPPFSSKNGYAHGCYDADSELLYFT